MSLTKPHICPTLCAGGRIYTLCTTRLFRLQCAPVPRAQAHAEEGPVQRLAVVKRRSLDGNRQPHRP